ncbi:MAG: T9SS type A sorting domain-containing protein [Ignavibacteriaceae bacterium]
MKIIILVLFIAFCSFFYLPVKAQNNINDYTASINGKIVLSTNIEPGVKYSPDRKYKAMYRIGDVTDENRELYALRVFENENFIYQLEKVPGSDIELSDAGIMVVYDHTYQFKGELTLRSFSKTGNKHFEKIFYGANAFQFSESGNAFAVRDRLKIYTYNFGNNKESEYPKGLAFAFDETDEGFVVADENEIRIYKNSEIIRTINHGITLPRKIILSANNKLAGVIDKYNLNVYNISDGNIIFSDQLGGNDSFRDLKFSNGDILAGIQTRTKALTKGSIKTYSLNGSVKYLKSGESKIIKQTKPGRSFLQKQNQYEQIPWPFFPHDTTHTVWNHYEQHMGGGPDWSYLHQGLDIITPINEPTYAVKSGIVKCVLTLGGELYWRLAISDSNIENYSNGWLYAHLVENTIAVDIGDTVEQYDYLGNIIYWTAEWGHIHFVEIRDTGFVWQYNDDEWGINFNPLLALTPVHDESPPQIENVFPGSKFGFCENETSIYLSPDSLYGEIDIIVKVVDYIGDSGWQQPAYKINYWIKRVDTEALVLDTTLSHVLNHVYTMYNSGHYEPYATVLYKRDQTFPSPSWMDPVRNYYHVITNNDGDSIITLSDKDLAFNTGDYVDGDYRIYVQAFDPNENYTIDSMDVFFKNGITSVNSNNNTEINSFMLEQNYPNPFNPVTTINFSLAVDSKVVLKIFDLLGQEVVTILNNNLSAGNQEISFNAGEFNSGVYFYRIEASGIDGSGFFDTKKMVLTK